MNKSLATQVLPKPLSDEIERVLNSHNLHRANPDSGVVSTETRKERRLAIRLAFAQLWERGYRLKTAKSFADRHVQILVERWDAEGLAAGTLHNRISHLSTFAGWIGKPGMVKRPVDYLDKARVGRTYIAKENRAWEAKGLSPEEVIEKARHIDVRLAMYLTLQHRFGLRVKESLEFRPLLALAADGKSLDLFEGTKGGRRRAVPIETKEQIEAIEMALEMAKTTRNGRLRWPGRTFKQAQRHFYYLMQEKLGISRKTVNATAHDLRHGYSHVSYRRHTGLPTPIEGGAIGRIDRETHRWAGLQVSKSLGHSRLPITGAYYGSYGHSLRNATVIVHPIVFNSAINPTSLAQFV